MEALLEALNPRGRRSPVLPTLLAGSALAVAVALGLALGLPVSEPEPEPEPVGQTSATRPGRAQTCSVDRTRIDALWNPIRADAIADELGTGTGTWRRAAERLDHWTEDWLRVQATTCDELTHELHDLRLACLAGQLDRLAVTLDELATPTLDRRRIDGVIGVIAGLPGPDRCLDDVALRERSWAPQPDSNERLAELEASTNQLAVRFELGRTQARATSIESARQLVVAADELGSPGLHARALLLLANHLEREANSGVEAERVLLEAMRVSASVREFEIEVAAALGLAKLLGARGLPEDALRWVVLAEGLVGLAPTDLALRAACATTRATIALGRSDWAAAQVALERALELLESHGSDNLQLPIVASDLAGVLEHQGQRPRALELRRRALAIHERQHGPDHPRVGWARRDLAVALLALGESESARVEFSQALANLEANLGPGRETALVRDQLEWLEHAGPSE